MTDPCRPPFEPAGVATGIGSLPQTEVSSALEAVFTHLPHGPFWPQLPRRSPLEGMTLQYVPGLPGLVEAEGAARLDTGPCGQGELAAFYERLFAGETAHSALDPARAVGFAPFVEHLQNGSAGEWGLVKGHVTGPVTLASSLKDPNGREIIHEPAFAEAVAHHLAANAVEQVRCLQGCGAPVVIFLDEPVMEAYGSAYSTLNEATVRSLWKPVLDAVAEAGGLSGIHCCGNTDWELLLDCGADIVNFDAYDFGERLALYAGAVDRFLERGGVLAWGIVPTDERAFDESAGSLVERLERRMAQLASAGVDAGRLRRQCLLTPACGLGSVSAEQAVQVLSVLNSASRSFRQG